MIFQTSACELLEKKPAIEKSLSLDQPGLSAFSFAAVFAWKDFYRFECEVKDGLLTVVASDRLGSFFYLPPLGKKLNSRIIKACFEKMSCANHGRGVSRIENVPEAMLDSFPMEQFSRHAKNYEYCYFRQDLADLKGNAYKSQRADYNQCVKNHSPEFLDYDRAMRSECLGLYEHWTQERRAKNQDPVYGQMLDDNLEVHRTVMEYDRELGVTGKVVRVKDKIKAYSFGFPLTDKVFCVYLEVADVKVKGLPVFIFRRFCSDQGLRRYKFINAMDDFAMENVARTKFSFHPVLLLSSYVISQKC